MATAKKKAAKSAAQPRNLTKAEYRKLFDHIGKARVMAYQMSGASKYNARVRRTLRSLEAKLWSLGNDYPWSDITD